MMLIEMLEDVLKNKGPYVLYIKDIRQIRLHWVQSPGYKGSEDQGRSSTPSACMTKSSRKACCKGGCQVESVRRESDPVLLGVSSCSSKTKQLDQSNGALQPRGFGSRSLSLAKIIFSFGGDLCRRTVYAVGRELHYHCKSVVALAGCQAAKHVRIKT